MSAVMTVEEAQRRLKDVIASLAPGDKVILTDNHQPVAKLVSERPVTNQRPAPGLGKGSVLYMAPDFDETPREFEEYME